MATIKDIKITRNWGKRPTGSRYICNEVYVEVDKGDPYDLVQFSINELEKSYYWHTSIGVKCGTSEDEIKEIVEEYAREHISKQDIKDYTRFLEDGERWGWGLIDDFKKLIEIEREKKDGNANQTT